MGKSVDDYLYKDIDRSRDFFSGIFKDYHLQMLRIARFYLTDYVLAEDVVSDVFTKLWEKRFELNEIQDLKGYLFVMVKRKCLDEANKCCNKKVEHLENASPRYFVNFKSPEITLLNNELAERLSASLQKLPEKCRTVFLLIKEDKLKYKEVAQLLNISEKTVEMHVGNALKALRKDLEAYATPSSKKKSISRVLVTVKSVMLSLF